uniref:Uncharacterized protein n=1 Tax=Anopheles funestus TaxID=62324 RepID=A0A182REH5_ANOFN
MRMLLATSGWLLFGTLLITSLVAAEDISPVKSSPVEELAVVNYGNTNPATVTTHIKNAAGDKLDFNGDHFFGPDKEQHDYNRQAHLKLEYVRNQDPQLRRFLGKSIVKRQADYPYPPAVYPPTHYEPPTTVPPTTTTTTTTTTTPVPTTTTTTEPPPPPPPPPTPGVPHEVYGVPPSEEDPQTVLPCSTGNVDCVFTQLPPLPSLVYPSAPAPLPTPVEPQSPGVLCNHEQVPLVGGVPAEPSQGSLYNLNELVGVLLDGAPVPSESWSTDSEPSSGGTSSCSECNFEQLPGLPELVYPSVPSATDTLPPPPPPPPLSPVVPEEPTGVLTDCLPAEHRVRVENGNNDQFVDLRFSKSSSKLQPRVLSTHSQVILVQSMAPYPVLKAKPGHAPPNPLNRGSLKFKHSRKESHYNLKRFEQDQVWNPNEDSVVVPSAEQQGEVAQIVLCTVDCHAVEEKVNAPETTAMEIPSDGRLW